MIAAKRNPAIGFRPCFRHSGLPDRLDPSSGIKTLKAVVSSLVDRYNKQVCSCRSGMSVLSLNTSMSDSR